MGEDARRVDNSTQVRLGILRYAWPVRHGMETPRDGALSRLLALLRAEKELKGWVPARRLAFQVLPSHSSTVRLEEARGSTLLHPILSARERAEPL